MLTSVITLDQPTNQLSSLFTLVRLESSLQGIEWLTYTCLNNKGYLDGKIQCNTAFKWGLISQLKWCEQDRVSFCLFTLPSSELASCSDQALLHCLLVFSSAIANSDAILVPSSWYVTYFFFPIGRLRIVKFQNNPSSFISSKQKQICVPVFTVRS